MSLTADLPPVFKGRSQILQPMQIAVPAGQVLGVIGPNGAGKSTLLRSLAGIDVLHARWNGQPLSHRQIGYMPQAFQMNARLSVLEAVLLGKREALGWRIATADLEAAGAVLADLGLAHLEGRSMDRLSGGQQQMVLLAQRILRAPRLLVLDEPTSALDLHHQLVILRHLKSYAQDKGAVVALALHDLTLAARFCDRLLLIDKGQRLVIGDNETVLTSRQITESWNITPELLRARDGFCVIVPH
ncbi:ABC transporter ATP-binding protein [Rhodobacter ferrooxidans]|uniref:ABC transporter related protein n=1 Tax=Rhodobacter ferrooxidans TaxID=371731 RepID=C8S434_9RHOB|nr:ABC transporter ATP-binding protein [Rhodobacter sp. SW2]EEW24296.1 ABC transporter related protein [Rhodobacter sp. SW2]